MLFLLINKTYECLQYQKKLKKNRKKGRKPLFSWYKLENLNELRNFAINTNENAFNICCSPLL